MSYNHVFNFEIKSVIFFIVLYLIQSIRSFQCYIFLKLESKNMFLCIVYSQTVENFLVVLCEFRCRDDNRREKLSFIFRMLRKCMVTRFRNSKICK